MSTIYRNPFKQPRLPLEEMTPMERLIGALILAVTAPSDELAAEAVEIAEWFSIGLSDSDVDRAKAATLAMIREAT